MQPGPEGLRRATDRAGVQQRLISGEAEQPELKDRLHQGPGLFQGVQRVEAVEQQGEQLRAGLSLLGGGLRHLGKIGGQGQGLQVLAHRPELFQGVGLGEGGKLPPLGQGELRVHQQLAGRGELAVLPPAAPGLHRALAPVPGEDGENLVRLFIVGLPQDDSLGGQAHGLSLSPPLVSPPAAPDAGPGSRSQAGPSAKTGPTILWMSWPSPPVLAFFG